MNLYDYIKNIKSLYGLVLADIGNERYYTKLSNPYMETVDIWSILRPNIRFSLEKVTYSPKGYISIMVYFEQFPKNYFNIRFRDKHNWLDVWAS